MCDVRKGKTLEIVPIYYYCLGCMLMFCSCAIYCTKCIANKHDFTCQSCVFRMYTDIVGSVFYVYGKNLSFHVVEHMIAKVMWNLLGWNRVWLKEHHFCGTCRWIQINLNNFSCDTLLKTISWNWKRFNLNKLHAWIIKKKIRKLHKLV